MLLKGFKESLLEVGQAILPIALVVIVLQIFIISMPTVTFIRFLLGALMVMVGLLLFLQGVRTGLLPMGSAMGSELPKLNSLLLLLLMAFVLGFTVTVAEPDVRVLAYQVEFVSDGYVGSSVLILSVALGIGIFVSLSMARIVLRIPIAYLLGAGYVVILVLSFFVPAHFVPIAFDAGGVTTGPVAAPFILALGLGTVAVLGGRTSISDGFGLVGLASIGPVIGVMILGIIYG